MDEGGSPTLGVGFIIDPGESFDELTRLQAVMGSTETQIIKDAASIEKATGSMINLTGATASVSTFGNAATRELQSAAAESAKAEKAGESLSRQMEKQASTFGLTATEIRKMKVETAAAAAEQAGLTELAARLIAREQALYDMEYAAQRRAAQAAEDAAQAKTAAADAAIAASEREAQALREAALAYQMFEAAARKGVAALREQEAAEAAAAVQAQSLAAAGERLRASIDPSVAAQQRFNREMDQARTLVSAGTISLDEYCAKLRIEQAVLKDAAAAHANSANAIGKNSFAMRELAIQIPDVVQGLLTGQRPMQVFLQQGGQMTQIAMMAQGGIKGLATQLLGLAAAAAPILIVAGAVAVGAAAWLSYSNEVAKAQSLAQGSGRIIGITADDFNKASASAASLVTISVGGARDIATSYVQLGGVSKDVLGGLTALTVEFAAATGKDTKDAVEDLGRAFQDPVKGAEDLTERYGVLNGAQIEHIKKLVEQNDMYGAQKALLKALEPAFDGAADHANILARAWRSIATTAADAWTWMGRAIDRAAGGGTTLEKIADLQKKKNDDAEYYRNLGMSAPAGLDADLDKQIAELRAQQAADEKARGVAAGLAKGAKGMGIVDSILGDDQIGDLRTRLSMVKGLLSDGGKAAGLTADQVSKAREAYDMLSHAVDSYIPEGKKAVELAQLDAKIATAKKAGNAAQVASLTAQKTEIENSGKLITGANAQAIALANANKARVEAQKTGDKHAATLAREAAATEAQIKNLYASADAYKISGAAALIADARVKGESQAIKDRGDVEAAVDRQVRLAIATRVADAAKSTAAMRDQVAAQERANGMVEAGILPASKAAEYVKNQIADLPLLAAIQAAQQRGLATEADKATKALADQRAERLRLLQADEQARYDASQTSGSNQIASLQAELQLVGANDAVRVHTLAVIKATQEAQSQFTDPVRQQVYIAQQVKIADLAQSLTDKQRDYNDALSFTADKWDLIASNVTEAASGLADAFGPTGKAIGDIATRYAAFNAQRTRLDKDHNDAIVKAGADQGAIDRENQKYALQTATSQIDMFGDMAEAAKGFFGENSKGYKALAEAEKAFRAIQFVLSVRAMAQDAIETASSIAKSVLRAGKYAVEAVAKAISSLPFPANLVAGAATAAALAAIGISIFGGIGGGGNNLEKANDGTGTVLGDSKATSDSIKNALDALKEVDTVTNVYARQMAESLKSIDNQIGGVAAQIVRAGDVNADSTVNSGFKANLIGSVLGAIPLVGGLLKSLFGTSTSVIGNGLYGGPQSIGSVLNGGFDASYYSDVEKKKKFLGITTGTSYSTQYSAADPSLTNQFTLILKQFNDAIVAAAGPLGQSTADIQNKLSGFIVDIGKIDLKGLTGQQISDKLSAVFGAAADDMAAAAFPGLQKFQKVGEGAFETLVRVSSTVEAVTNSLAELGNSTSTLGIDAKMALADQFDSISDLTSAFDAYFQGFYTKEEQAAAQTAQFSKVFESLGLQMPSTLAAFRALVEAQDLTTAAGQATYAELIKLAPAFADLQNSLSGAKSAADIASERDDLQRQLLQLQGDTAAIRALDLAKLDPSNRALQQQIWDLSDAQDAAKAAQDLADAWKSVGDSIMDEVKRIRGLTDTGGGSFADLLGQFNAATAAARGGDQDAAKSLPGLSQSLLTAAAAAATSKQELDRIQAQTAASLEATYAALQALMSVPGSGTSSGSATVPVDTLLAAINTATTASAPTAANDDLVSEIQALREEVAGMRADNNSGHAANASANNKTAKILDTVTAGSGGQSVSTEMAA